MTWTSDSLSEGKELSNKIFQVSQIVIHDQISIPLSKILGMALNQSRNKLTLPLLKVVTQSHNVT